MRNRSRIPSRIGVALRSHGWLIAIAVAYLYLFPYFPKINSANELPRIYLIKAIADEHRFAVDTGVKRWVDTGDISPSGGHKYSNKAPGSSMMAAAPYFVVRVIAGEPSLAATFWIARVFAGILPMLAFLVLLYRFLERVAPDPAIRKLVLVAYALGSMAMTYSILFYSHQLAAICAASAWILALDVVDGRRPMRAMVVAGALAGASPLVDYQAVFAIVPVAIYVLVRMVPSRDWPREKTLRAVGLATLGAAIPIAILLGYHTVCFGSPLRTGYDASTVYAHHHQQGFLGITELRWEAFHGSFFAPDNGLFALSPWLLLAIPGGVLAWRVRERGIVVVGACVAAIFILFISSINFWRGGWEVGPRYITAMLPFLVPLVAAALQAWRSSALALGLAASTIVFGVAIYALSSATFPYWPDSFAHPFVEVTLRMLREDLVAPSLASALGIDGVAGIVPFLALCAALVGWTLYRAGGWRSLAIATVGGTALVVAFAFAFPSGAPTVERPYKFVRMAVVDAHS